MGGVFCKKADLSSTQGALCTVSVFFILHFTYFGGRGCVRPQRTPYLRACSTDRVLFDDSTNQSADDNDRWATGAES